jgi:AcrR family transcriptional regulator
MVAAMPAGTRLKAAAARPDRREQIVAAAAKVLAREGYERASMKQIADEVGVASGLLHYYFENKAELLAEVVAGMHDEIDADWRKAIEGVDDPFDRISVAISRVAARFEERPEFWRLLVDMYAVGLRNPVIGQRLRRMCEDMITHVVEESERISGVLPTPSLLPSTDVAVATLGALDGIAVLSLVRGTGAEGAFRALKAFVLAYAGMAYVAAGKEPPLDRMAAYLAGR